MDGEAIQYGGMMWPCNPSPEGCTQVENLKEIRDNISDMKGDIGTMQTDIAVLKNQQANIESFVRRVEERVFSVVGDLKAVFMKRIDDSDKSVMEKLDKMDKAINVGNGTPSILSRLNSLETVDAVRLNEMASRERFWKRLSPFLPWITAILGAAGMFGIKSIK